MDKIEDAFFAHLGRHTSYNEVRAWNNSLQYMDRVLGDPAIPQDCGVSIEYQPLNPNYYPIVLDEADSDSFRIIGEFIGVVNN